MAVNKEKQKREVEKKKHPTDKYASDGESHPSSVESTCGLLSPGTVGHSSPEPLYNAWSSDEYPNDAEILELLSAFSDGLPNPDADLEADLSISFDDLFSMHPSENGMEAIPESNSNSSTVEQPKSPRTPAGLVQVDSSTAVENKPILYLQPIQVVVWQLIRENPEENFCNEASTSNSCKQ